MMGLLWVVLFVALTGSQVGHGLPIGPSPSSYPQESPQDGFTVEWGQRGLLAAVPALALVLTAAGLLLGCTWCYQHKDCKQNQGNDNQLFSAQATHAQDASRRAAAPDSGFSEPANNNVAEDNNNGPISLREMQNIANNNAAAYIVSENEERNRAASRESVVLFEPLPAALGVLQDPLERCADWFGADDFPRSRLQYLREIGRGWFGRIVEGELETTEGSTSTVAVKILNQNASSEEKARFLDEATVYRDVRHEHVLGYVARCLQEDPWILLFELCSMDLQQYLVVNRPKMASLNEAGAPLRLQCDVTAALAYLHSHGLVYGNLWSGNVLVRGSGAAARAVLGRYSDQPPPAAAHTAPELHHRALQTTHSEVWAVGGVLWEVCAWGAAPDRAPAPEPALPCPYREHLYQVMQMCWNPSPSARPTAAQVHSLLNHLYTAHKQSLGASHADTGDFEERWQTLKPNTIPKIDEHVAMVHAPSTSTASHFTGSETIQDSLSADLDTAVSRSSSIMSDKDHLSVQMKSESLNNLHGSLDDVGSVYHNESAVESLTNVSLNDSKDKEQDRSDSSMDPWLKDIIAGSQDDVSYYKDVSDVIKNLDNILNSEKTSSSESSHQASPSRDNLSLDCKKEYPPQSSLVKSPGISNFQNILDLSYEAERDQLDDEVDRETVGTLSHSFERHSDTNSQHTLENLTPDTPIKDLNELEREMEPIISKELRNVTEKQAVSEKVSLEPEMPKEAVTVSNSEAPQQRELVESMSSVSEGNIEQLNVQDCQTSCDKFKETVQNDTHESNRAKSDNAISNQGVESEKLALPVEEILTETNVQNIKKVPETVVEVEQVVIEIKDNHEENEIREHASNFVDQLIRQTADIIEHERAYSALRDMPIQKLEDIVVNNHNDSKDKNIDKSEGEHGRSESENNDSNIIKSFSVEPSIAYNDNERDDNEDSREIVLEITSIADLEKPVQVNYEEIVFEDKHMSGEENLLDGANEVHQSEPSSAADILPDLIGNIDLPSDEAKTKSISESIETHSLDTQSTLPLGKPDDIVQIIKESKPQLSNDIHTDVDNDEIIKELQEEEILPKCYTTINTANNESTIYMDLINDAKCDDTNKNDSIDSNMKQVIKSCVDSSNVTNNTNECTLVRNDSTVYMDLPTALSVTDKFLNSERVLSSQTMPYVITNETKYNEAIPASTPKGSDCEEREETNVSLTKIDDLSETKTPDYGPGVTLTKLEQKFIPDNVSPFDSPTKSHPTDTYDENSSVVLGPFENCSLELFKGIKSTTGYTEIDAAKEELLAFSSNFSDINLETPSPLRDSNFLNEVPDIEINDDLIFDDINEMSEAKSSEATEPRPPAKTLDHTDGPPPSTPPNSPGTSLVESSQTKYVIDVDLNQPELVQSGSGVGAIPKEIDLNQIETTKLAMAENENNLNIEYSGPMSVEGLVTDDLSESYLAGNGLVSVDEPRETFVLDEASMQALRNELELKLPLAQVASVEPSDDVPPWSAPDLVVNYPGALSPIAEETGHQLSAYENDRIWNASIRTDSSESYLEPCNNSTDSVTELPTGALHSAQPLTYTVHSGAQSVENNTYTLQKDATTSRDLTMSADSLNASPAKKNEDAKSPIDDRTFNKEDEKEAKSERLSQESPFLLSPTTDASAPERSDNLTGVCTLSQSTVPTDAKISKPTDTACLSKATSIDSWCSNDTLYNVEENFDDLAIEAEVPQEFEDDKDHSESSDTLTHNDDDKELSHCSTYIVHDSKSEGCDTFSPDSITANCTSTKPKTETAEQSPAVDTANESSPKNSQTKDLAYGTLVSGLGSYSNCTTELLSGHEDYWKLPQPELVRRSPIGDDMANLTPPKFSEKVAATEDSPQLESVPSVNKMESVNITCLHDDLVDDSRILGLQRQATSVDSPNFHFRNMAQSIQSTPILDAEVEDDVTPISMQLPEINTPSSEFSTQIPNFQSFINSAELRPQDMSSNQDTGLLLEGDSRSLSRNSTNRDIRSPTYSDFESSALARPQDVHSKSSQSVTSGTSSEDFRVFENSVKNRPQDLSSVPNSSLQEGKSTDFVPEASTNEEIREDKSENVTNEQNAPRENTDPVVGTESYFAANFILIDEVPRMAEPGIVDETQQPHSIIITESPKNADTNSANATYDSHTETKLNINNSYDSHDYENQQFISETHPSNAEKIPIVNGIEKASPKNIANDTTQNAIDAAMENFELFRTDPVVMNVITETAPELVLPNGCHEHESSESSKDAQCNGAPAQYATVNFINESFEELRESNVDGHNTSKTKLEDDKNFETYTEMNLNQNGEMNFESVETGMESLQNGDVKSESKVNGVVEEKKITENFLKNEKNFCQLDSYLILNDIRFTGPASEIMSTSFNEATPSEPTSPEEHSQAPPPAAADILKEWDSDSDDSRSSNPSSGEFIWKDGDGRETSVPSSYYQHNRGAGAPGGAAHDAGSGASDGLSGSGSGSGSEGEEVEFVPSSWDCRAEPGKSALRTLEQQQDSKKRVVFKRQKYHCVYEYPREASDACELSPAAALPDYSTYADWAAAAAEEAELSYSQLYGGHPFDMSYPLRAGGVTFGSDYDEDFFISSSAHPFESLGLMSTSSQFFPGLKGPLLERRDSLTDDVSEEYPPPPSPLHTALPPAAPLSLDFTTPDSGVEDITPGSTSTEDDFKTKKLTETDATQTQCWKSVDSGSSSESVSPSSPGEALGGLRHTRDKLKLDLPPSPCAPSPRHHRVFNFVLDKPRPRTRTAADPLVMTDDTPAAALPLHTQAEHEAPPAPTFSTFGKPAERSDADPPAIVLTDEQAAAGGSGGAGGDSGDEDSGIESSAKTTLERKQHSPNVS